MSVYEFGPFILQVGERRLTRDGQRLPLTGKSFDVLRLLVEAQGRLVDRTAFRDQLWPDVTVEDRNLTVHISSIRKLLGIAPPPFDYVETVAKAGYRIGVPIRVVPAEAAARDTQPMAGMEVDLLASQAREHLARSERVPALKALVLFERVLALAPNDAAAHAGLASTYVLLASTMIRRPLPVDEAVRLARESAQRALVLDGRLGEAWAVLGRLKMIYEWDWRGAEADLVQAVTRDRRSADAAEAHGWFLAAMGRHAAAQAELERARSLDPLRRETLERLGLARWMAGDAEGGLAALAEASALEPEARRPHFRRMIVLDSIGRHDEAMDERTIWLTLFGDPAAAQRLTTLRREESARAAMLEWIGRLERLAQWWEAALQWMAVGGTAPALDTLERCLAEHGTSMPFLLQYPPFRPLRGEPRFERMVEALGLS